MAQKKEERCCDLVILFDTIQTYTKTEAPLHLPSHSLYFSRPLSSPQPRSDEENDIENSVSCDECVYRRSTKQPFTKEVKNHTAKHPNAYLSNNQNFFQHYSCIIFVLVFVVCSLFCAVFSLCSLAMTSDGAFVNFAIIYNQSIRIFRWLASRFVLGKASDFAAYNIVSFWEAKQMRRWETFDTLKNLRKLALDSTNNGTHTHTHTNTPAKRLNTLLGCLKTITGQ